MISPDGFQRMRTSFWKAAVIAICLSTISLGKGYAAGCQTPHFVFVDEGVTIATTAASRGEACKLHFEFPSSTFGIAGILASSVGVRPKHGTLNKINVRFYMYMPSNDYTGQDAYELKVRYNKDDGSSEHATLLHVDITVN